MAAPTLDIGGVSLPMVSLAEDPGALMPSPWFSLYTTGHAIGALHALCPILDQTLPFRDRQNSTPSSKGATPHGSFLQTVAASRKASKESFAPRTDYGPEAADARTADAANTADDSDGRGMAPYSTDGYSHSFSVLTTQGKPGLGLSAPQEPSDEDDDGPQLAAFSLRPPKIGRHDSPETAKARREKEQDPEHGDGGYLPAVPRDQLGDAFTAVKELGRGESSTVWLARHAPRPLVDNVGIAPVVPLTPATMTPIGPRQQPGTPRVRHTSAFNGVSPKSLPSPGCEHLQSSPGGVPAMALDQGPSPRPSFAQLTAGRVAAAGDLSERLAPVCAIKTYRCDPALQDSQEYERLVLGFVMKHGPKVLKALPSAVTRCLRASVAAPSFHSDDAATDAFERSAADARAVRRGSRCGVEVAMSVANAERGLEAQDSLTADVSKAGAGAGRRRFSVHHGELDRLKAAPQSVVANPDDLLSTVQLGASDLGVSLLLDAFTHRGPYGDHPCLAFEVLGPPVDWLMGQFDFSGVPFKSIIRDILLSTLETLEILECLNVLHTDLKPENLLLCETNDTLQKKVAAMNAAASVENGDGDQQGSVVLDGVDAALEEPDINFRVKLIDFGLSYLLPRELRDPSRTINSASPSASLSMTPSSCASPNPLRSGLSGAISPPLAAASLSNDDEAPLSSRTPFTPRPNLVSNASFNAASLTAALAEDPEYWAEREEEEDELLHIANYTKGALIQTREYRAPEIIIGANFGPKADIWSLGCMAYELVTGRFLFDPKRAEGIESEEDMDVEHLLEIAEVLGDCPAHYLKSANGVHAPHYFSSRTLKLRHPLPPGTPKRHLFDELLPYAERLCPQDPEGEARRIERFILACIAWDPTRRHRPSQLMKYEFLSGAV